MTTTVLLLLALFGIKHFLADFVLQLPYMLAQKGVYGAEGGLHHAMVHGVLTVFIVMLFAPPIMALQMGLLDSVLHYHIDWVKQQVSRGLTVADQKFWFWFGADQTLHYLTYILIIGLLV